ncbi:hypothetical protein [Tichowtungia aerotolerans]|uniref:Uncharacterized protein n=1 Tax=Tichowtungia aerotolerans TaxID=2697043 RepID=A0A6P1M870_9BACT|nr:hypothetical protein [Tichowtungia aerotolerans]QHI70790.1 hypothetical protein GT409_15525 [Tichowtungia aerotolerans]
MSRKEIIILCVAGCGLFAAGLPLDARVWTNIDGTYVKGSFVRILFDKVLVEDAIGKKHSIPLARLSRGDLSYLYYHVPPEIEISVSDESYELPKFEWSREEDDVTCYRFSAQVSKTSELPYKANLTAELFVLGAERTRMNDDHLVLMAYERKKFGFQDEKKCACVMHFEAVPFHTYRSEWVLRQNAVARGKTLSGYILAVSDVNGRVVGFESDVKQKWVTRDLGFSVEKLRGLYGVNHGAVNSRHFNQHFEKVSPPRIPWFKRSEIH